MDSGAKKATSRRPIFADGTHLHEDDFDEVEESNFFVPVVYSKRQLHMPTVTGMLAELKKLQGGTTTRMPKDNKLEYDNAKMRMLHDLLTEPSQMDLQYTETKKLKKATTVNTHTVEYPEVDEMFDDAELAAKYKDLISFAESKERDHTLPLILELFKTKYMFDLKKDYYKRHGISDKVTHEPGWKEAKAPPASKTPAYNKKTVKRLTSDADRDAWIAGQLEFGGYENREEAEEAWEAKQRKRTKKAEKKIHHHKKAKKARKERS